MAHRLLVALLTCLVLAVGVATPGEAAAQKLEWKPEWKGVGWEDYLITGGATVGTIGVRYGLGPADIPRWRGPLAGDQFWRGALFSEDPSDIEFAGLVSDVLVLSLASYPVLVDSVAVTGIGYGEGELAYKTGMINVQALSISLFTTMVMKTVIGRERPLLRQACFNNPFISDEECEQREAVSFPSGHSSTAFVGAGLICLNHELFELYGGGAWDYIACGGALAAATTTAFLRIRSNNHYFSDIFVGSLIGLTSGLIVPRLLHYGFADDEDADEADEADGEVAAAETQLRPFVSPSMRGVNLGFMF